MLNQNSCGALVKQIHDEMEKNANNAMRADDMTMAQCGALLILNDAPGGQLPLKELERRLRVSQPTAAGLVKRMEQKKWIESFGSSEDKRIKILKITASGAECCRRCEQQMEQTEKALLSGLTETEKGIFLVLLKKVRDTL